MGRGNYQDLLQTLSRSFSGFKLFFKSEILSPNDILPEYQHVKQLQVGLLWMEKEHIGPVTTAPTGPMCPMCVRTHTHDNS